MLHTSWNFRIQANKCDIVRDITHAYSLNKWIYLRFSQKPPPFSFNKKRHANTVYQIEYKATTELHAKLTECITFESSRRQCKHERILQLQWNFPKMNQSSLPTPHSSIQNLTTEGLFQSLHLCASKHLPKLKLLCRRFLFVSWFEYAKKILGQPNHCVYSQPHHSDPLMYCYGYKYLMKIWIYGGSLMSPCCVLPFRLYTPQKKNKIF